jgi:hypothetical protein
MIGQGREVRAMSRTGRLAHGRTLTPFEETSKNVETPKAVEMSKSGVVRQW